MILEFSIEIKTYSITTDMLNHVLFFVKVHTGINSHKSAIHWGGKRSHKKKMSYSKREGLPLMRPGSFFFKMVQNNYSSWDFNVVYWQLLSRASLVIWYFNISHTACPLLVDFGSNDLGEIVSSSLQVYYRSSEANSNVGIIFLSVCKNGWLKVIKPTISPSTSVYSCITGKI